MRILLFAVHCGSIRQTATILSMDKDCLRTGDKATVHFRFIKTPEYLHIDQRLVFREGRTKAVGTITKVQSCCDLIGCGFPVGGAGFNMEDEKVAKASKGKLLSLLVGAECACSSHPLPPCLPLYSSGTERDKKGDSFTLPPLLAAGDKGKEQ